MIKAFFLLLLAVFNVSCSKKEDMNWASTTENQVKSYIKSGLDVNKKNKNGETPLMLAVNNKEVILTLIAAGVDINAKIFDTIENLTVLHVAASNVHFEIVKLLIDKGADVNDKNDEGKTALNLATNPDVISILTEAGAITDTEENKKEKILIQGALKQALITLMI